MDITDEGGSGKAAADFKNSRDQALTADANAEQAKTDK